ncbi:hypothetical protein PVK06_022816 [Gossypium arboreum]|uniref:BPL/LPL catalytic domain-containing protein n=2 Tax=Gossypium TaxID=3633 RepID=A0ABR0P9N6_GOSAR|nr:hypothetical protein PVK06_022816 [Gossypium arboreum]
MDTDTQYGYDTIRIRRHGQTKVRECPFLTRFKACPVRIRPCRRRVRVRHQYDTGTRGFSPCWCFLGEKKTRPGIKQLHIEEQLLRTSSENWCIVNDGTNDPTVVMGVSGKPAELLEIESVLDDQVPVIRRFTGGGTVIVDHGTVFVTFICNKEAVPNLQPYPRPIMSWSSSLYSKVFQGIGDFHLRENDYVFGNHKFGGNAQSITKNRWIHHTSFLWDFNVQNMSYLKHPKRAPAYRSARSHLDFICRMKDYMPRSTFMDKTVEATETQFSLRPIQLEAIRTCLEAEFCPSSRFLTNEELEAAAVALQS